MINRWTFWVAVSWLGLVGPDGLLAQKLVRGPYLQLPTQNSMVLRWRTDKESKGYVRWGLSPESATNRVNHAGSLTEHVVQIRGLKPNTRYYYSLGTETNRWITPVAPDYTFITPPSPAPASRSASGPLVTRAPPPPTRPTSATPSTNSTGSDPPTSG